MHPWGVNDATLWHHRPTVHSTDIAQLEGTVSRIVFTNPDSFWTVLKLLPAEDALEELDVVGTLAGVREGERLRVWGHWENNPRFGRQLRVQRYEVVLPKSAAGIERYLASGLIPGIGPKTARMLVKRFGDKTLEVIERHPERLKQVKGIGKKKVATLLKSWRDQASVRESMVFLLELGMTSGLAGRIYKEYGSEAAARVRANPYDLAQDVWGIGFLRADRIARELDIGIEDPARLRAGLIHVLKEVRSDGHVCLPRDRLLAAGERLLSIGAEPLTAALDDLTGMGRVHVEEPDELVYTPDLHAAERRAATNLIRLLDTQVDSLDEVRRELLIRRAESSLGVELAPGQRDAMRTALTSRVAVLTGGPGTGKTTIVRAIVESLEAMGETVALCAPTGRASKRLSASTGRDARTIHRLLEWQPAEGGFTRDEYSPLEANVVIVDEASMVDILLADALFRALSDSSRLILVGDVDQLPSVGPGAVLRDIIASRAVPVASLTQIFRQAHGSLITWNAHRILNGELPETTPAPSGEGPADFYWIEQEDPERILELMQKMIVGRIPAAFGLDPRSDVQVLTPMHRNSLGSQNLNQVLGALLNPGRGDDRFAVGDKVMQIRNNYEKEVFNGDVGFIDRMSADRRTLVVRFLEPPRIVTYEGNDREQLVLAWAISIHKSQGSEYPAVVVPLHTQHFMMLRRNLVYTALTRGKRLVVLVGSRKALQRALAEATVEERFGRLSERLKELVR